MPRLLPDPENQARTHSSVRHCVCWLNVISLPEQQVDMLQNLQDQQDGRDSRHSGNPVSNQERSKPNTAVNQPASFDILFGAK